MLLIDWLMGLVPCVRGLLLMLLLLMMMEG